MNCVFQKKDDIKYPRFTKLIIVDLMKKYPSIPQKHDEDYHSIKVDIPLVSVYSTGNVLFRGILIPDAFLTNEIHATIDYKKSTPRAHRIPTFTVASPQGKKRKQNARETSSPRKSHKITIRKKKQNITSLPSPGDDRERDEMAEATLLSLTLYKTALAAEAQEKITKVQDKLDEEEIEKMDKDENDKNDDDVEKADDVAEKKDNDDQTDHSLVETYATGSMETRNEHMQTLIPTPTRSPRNDLSLGKIILKELMTYVSPTIATTSKTKIKRGFTSNKINILPGSIAGICRRRSQIRTHIKTKFVTHEFFIGKIREVLDQCNNVVPEMTFENTNEMIKE
nr:hypothetical protein [Tanacetum cinerariifolium]